MTSALVVYESILGNTQAVARAVAEGLGRTRPVTVTEVSRAPETLPPDVGLLVVGGPTHAFGLSRPETRRDAAAEATDPVVSQGRGLREWLDALEPSGAGVRTAAFDTRVLKPRVPGSAAKKARKRLRSKGFADLVDPESFYVHGKAGPLAEGELDRARAWGADLARRFDEAESSAVPPAQSS
jgi:Flavodoxin